MIEYIILFGTAFVCNALMDEIVFHKNTSKFINWFKKYPSLYRWLYSSYKDKHRYLFNLFDGFHTFKFLLFCLIGVGIMFNNLYIGVIYFISWAVWFNLIWFIFKRNQEK